jgi:heat shock protein HtpX
MMSERSSFSIESALRPDQLNDLIEQVRKYHLLLHPERFQNVRRGTVGGKSAVAFIVIGPQDGWRLEADVWAEQGFQVRIERPEGVPEGAVQWLYKDLLAVVRDIEKDIEKASITLIWVKGERIVPEEMPSVMRRTLGRLFSRSLLLLNVLLFAFNIILFILIGISAVIFILLVQLMFIIFADVLFGALGKWNITPDSPQVYLLQIKVDRKVMDDIKEKKVDLALLKQAVFESAFARGKEPSCPVIGETLLRFGIFCSEENIKVREINVLELVRKAAEPFHAPLPKIVISNSLVPNAAASGVSFRRGVLLLTGGILTSLDEEELISVIGHELGHLRGRDPLFLYAIVSGEFLLRVTLLFPLFLFSPILYLIFATFGIFFVAKFFEARADLLSVMIIGKPRVLAESLRKIGGQRLQAEEASKLGSWLRWDTHPPLYFRIERLEGMSTPVVVKHPLLQSAKDVIGGFRAAFRA